MSKVSKRVLTELWVERIILRDKLNPQFRAPLPTTYLVQIKAMGRGDNHVILREFTFDTAADADSHMAHIRDMF